MALRFRQILQTLGKRDFYRLPAITLDDEHFARKMIDAPGGNPSLVKLNMGWLDAFATPSRLRRLLEARGLIDDALEKAIRDSLTWRSWR